MIFLFWLIFKAIHKPDIMSIKDVSLCLKQEQLALPNPPVILAQELLMPQEKQNT